MGLDMKDQDWGRRYPLRISRRRFNNFALSALAVSGILLVNRGHTFNPDKYGYFGSVDELEKIKLRTFSPLTVGHNGANTESRLEQSLNAHMDFIEADVSYNNRSFWVGHEKRILGFFSYDEESKAGWIGGPKMFLEDVLLLATNTDKKLLLDLKDVYPGDIDKLLQLLSKYEALESSAFSGKSWRTLTNLIAMGVKSKNIFFTINSRDGYEAFKRFEVLSIPFGVSLNKSLADPGNISALQVRGGRVLVYKVDSGEDALTVLRNGANGLISNNLSLLEIWENNQLS